MIMLAKKGKWVCPSCGRKRFVPFVDETGAPINVNFYGRCDRENSCGYYRRPGREYRRRPAEYVAPTLLPLYFDNVEGAGVVTAENTLLRAFAHYFCPGLLAEVMREYRCGTGSDGCCWYYQYDGTRYRTGKAIRYTPDGHRQKAGYPVIWYHQMKRVDMNTFELVQCWYGQHLLDVYPTATVRIVEAEKTAILMTCYSRERGDNDIYIATGGSNNIRRLDRSPLEGRRVVVIPDDGGCKWEWMRYARQYGYDFWQPICRELPDGYDVWDVIEYFSKKKIDEKQ